jgi:hypothetical protein
MAAAVWDWLSANSDAIKAIGAFIAIPGALWGCFLWFKKLRGVGLDDRVDDVSDKTDRLLRENRSLRQQTMQVRKLMEQVLLKLEREALTPDLIENIEQVAKMTAGQNEKWHVETFAKQLRQQPPANNTFEGSSEEASDALAVLAHIIGRTDPFADLTRSIGPAVTNDADGVGQGASAARADYNPLGELARIIGKTDPFAIMPIRGSSE